MMKQIELILASASPRREALLRQIGLEPVIIPSEIEEKVASPEPVRVVTELSRQKAEEVAGRLELRKKAKAATGEPSAVIAGAAMEKAGSGAEAVVVGADTVVAAAGRILGKPRSEEEAFEMLSLLSGGSHKVFTGVTLICGERTETFYEETEVFVYPMTPEEIWDYINLGESMDKAGAYGIQGRFAAHIKGIRGSYTNVMGLPAGRVYQELKKLVEEQDD